ncbi:MAG: hypothetical protein RSE47_06245 [Acidaminococcaceae bacterium]
MATKKENKFLTKAQTEGGFFGLGRAIDFDDGVTRIALLITILTSVAATIWQTSQGVDSEASVYFGVNTAAAFLFAWLIAQELDPDRKLGGIIGGGIAVVMSLALGVGNIIALLWLLFILRLLNRTSGSRHKIGDNAIILVIAYWLGRDGYWLYPTLTGLAYIVESQIQNGYFRSLYVGGLAFALTAMANMSKEPATLSLIYLYIMAATFVLFLPEVTVAAITKFKGDKDGVRIIPRRLQTAQGLFLVFTFALAWVHGDTQAVSLAPAWGAGIGVGIYLLSTVVQTMIFKK